MIIKMDFMSKTLMRNIGISIILPESCLDTKEPIYSLYLLHGIFGDYVDWITYTDIRRLSEEHNIAVIMPSGENSFYVDNEKNHALYGKFVGEELVQLMRKLFHISLTRESTFIAGLSMGGYGALRNGLKYFSNFSYIAGFSSALITDNIHERTDDVAFFIESRSFAETCFGDLYQVKNSDKDIKYLLKTLDKSKMPKILLTCGLQDPFINLNQNLYEYAKKLKIDITFIKEQGKHDWTFWNQSLYHLFSWLPLSKNEKIQNSGNIGI